MKPDFTQAFLASLDDPVERQCFVVAALMMQFNRSGLVVILRELEIEKPARPGKSKPSAVSATDLAVFLETWVRAKVARDHAKHPLTHRIHPVWGERCLLDPSMRPMLRSFKARLAALGSPGARKSIPIRYMHPDDFRMRNQLICRCAIYLNEAEQFESLMNTFPAANPWATDQRPRLDQMLPVQASVQAVGRLPTTVRKQWIAWAVARSFVHFRLPAPEILSDLARDLSPENQEQRLHVGFLLAMSDADVNVADLYNKVSDPIDLQIQALVALRNGQWNQARTFARAAHTASTGETKRKPRLVGPAAPLLTLLLATGTAEDKSIAEMQGPAQRTLKLKLMIAAVAGDRSAACVEAFLQSLDEGWDLQNALAMQLSATFWPLYPPAHARAAEVQRQLSTFCRELAQRLKARDFSWVAAQLSAAATGRVPSPNNSKTSDGGLLSLCAITPAWEAGLEKLERLLERTQFVAAPSQGVEAKQSRLVFALSISQGNRPHLLPSHVMIEPRLQKRQGAKWSVGRAVALQKLFDGTSDAPITSADRKVANTIRVNKSWNDTHWHFSQAALASLVGHPGVVWGDDATGPFVSVVQGQIELRVKQTDDGSRFEFYPPPEVSGYAVSRPEPNRLVVVSLTDAQTEIMQAIGSLPPVPSHAHERLGATISRLSGLFQVQSAKEFAGLSKHSQEVTADARPVLLLCRANPGLNIVVGVEPLGQSGPSFVPGKGLANIAAEVKGERLTCQRDLAAETRMIEALVSLHQDLVFSSNSNTLCIGEFGKCLEILRVLTDPGSSAAVSFRWTHDDPITVFGAIGSSNLRLELKTVGQWLELSGHATLDESLVLSMSDLLDAGNLKRGYVQLADGRYVVLSSELSRQMRAMAAVAGNTGNNERLALPASALGFVGGWLNDLKDARQLKSDAASAKQLARIEQAFQTVPVVPATLDAELREYQEVGFAFLSRLASFGAGAILADDMGLGKTLMTLALLLERAKLGPALVVTPLSVKANWQDEARKFSPTLNFVSLHEAQLGSLAPSDVVVCSYAVMVQNIAILEKLAFATLVLDEAQSVKNANTQRAQAACRLNGNARVCLTGTPIENHLGDLYSLMNIANPGLLGTAKGFEDRFAKPIQRDADRATREALLAIVSPFVLRRRKADVLKELPSRTEILCEVEPDPPERAFLEALRRKAVGTLQNSTGHGESAIHILAELTRLRRAACHPKMVSPDADVGAAKLDALLALVHDLRAGQHRALIFSQFVDFLQIVRDRFATEGISSQYLDGSCSEKARRDAVSAFQAGEGDVFLISLKAGGFGLNLTAADYVIHLDPWWNPAVEDQASDRAHRYGQTRPVTIYRLVTAGSVEQKVLALHAKKRDLAENILRETSTPTALDAASLMSLLAP